MGLFTHWRRRRALARLNRPPPGMTQTQSDTLATAVFEHYGFTTPPPTDEHGYCEPDVFAGWLDDNAAAMERLRAEQPSVHARLKALHHTLAK